jgi:threonine aldolase|tara:strand:- start:933 stop:1964 length:1032 start_codon:yes stop_codon:yes gene_type:complete
MICMIDLRSDTVTQPTEAMKAAMVAAPLGDDVLGDDPTILLLQQRCAELFGKDAACFVPSGSMANQSAIRAQTSPGDEIICHRDSHVYCYEAGAWAALSGCSIALLDGPRGQFEPEDVAAAIQADDHHFATSRLLVVENTQNRGGGAVWPLRRIEAVTAEARKHGLRCHLDGARIWNASAASGVSLAEYARHFDTVSACFSKGLGCPVGSIICSDADTIHRVHRARKMLGGAMRQSGILAAAALYALDHHRDRLVDDHAHARRIAESLAGIDGVSIDPDAVETNIIYFDVQADAATVVELVESHGIRMLDSGPHTIRAVTSLAVDDSDMDVVCESLPKVLACR